MKIPVRVTAEEYAAQNRIHLKTVQGMCRKGTLVARKVARVWQIDVEASERALSLRFGNAAERELVRRA